MNSKKTILIVEDEEPILVALQRILELKGEYEAVIAQDGVIALEKLQTIIPDLIISDISMPNLNGIDLCKKVRENPVTKSIPFIFLTAKKERMIEGLSVGGDDFLMKPFNIEEVLVKIETLFRRVLQSREQASQHKGHIEDVSVENIIESCLREKISGELVLQNENEVGVIKLEYGDIISVSFKELKDEVALDAMRSWETGTFVIRPLDIKIKVNPQTISNKIDLKKAHEIEENVWWVGHADETKAVQQNVYLRIFEKENKNICAVIDPGSPLYFYSISEKIASVLGDISKINIYIPMDASPAVCLNSIFIRKANSRAVCMTSHANWNSIKHYDINPKSVKKVDLQNKQNVTLASGHTVKFIETPFCGSSSAYIIYDVESRTLFSGALFSSDCLDADKDMSGLYASDENWEAIRRYHEKNISSNDALINILNRIEELDPKPELIAPRFGKLIRGKEIEFFTERLKLLQVGINNIIDKKNNHESLLYLQASNTLITQIQSFVPTEKAINAITRDANLSVSCHIKDGMIDSINGNGDSFYLKLIRFLMDGEDESVANQVKTAALKIAFSLGLKLPEF